MLSCSILSTGDVAEMAKKHSSEAFYALDDPLEAAVFSVLVEMMKERIRP